MTEDQAYRQSTESVGSEQGLADHLYEGAKQAIQAGASADNVLAHFNELFLTADAEGRETDRDALAEVMDCLTGWCSPQASLRAS